MTSENASKEIINKLIELECGSSLIQFRLRDWGISRQRYWGCPIPVVYDDHEPMVVNQEEMPIQLPELKDSATPIPLSQNQNFINLSTNQKRETDTFDTFMDSSWYYARFTSADNDEDIFDSRTNYWLPVDLYIGGIEHAILHLLYLSLIHI